MNGSELGYTSAPKSLSGRTLSLLIDPNKPISEQLKELRAKYNIGWTPTEQISKYREPPTELWTFGPNIFINPPVKGWGEGYIPKKPPKLMEETFFRYGHNLDPGFRPFAFRLSVLAPKYVPKKLPVSNLDRLMSYNRAVSKLRSAVFLDSNAIDQFLENPNSKRYTAKTIGLAFYYGNRSFSTGDAHFAIMSLHNPKFTGKLLLDVSKSYFTPTVFDSSVGVAIRRELLKLGPYINLMSEPKNDMNRGQAIAAAYAIVNKMKDDYALPRDADDHFATAYLLSIAPYISNADFNKKNFIHYKNISKSVKDALFGRLNRDNPYARVDLSNPYFQENIFTEQENYLSSNLTPGEILRRMTIEYGFNPRVRGLMGQRYDEIYGGEPGKGKHWLEYGLNREQSLYYLGISGEIQGLLNKLRSNYVVAARLNAAAGLPPPERPIVTSEDLKRLHELMSDVTIGRKAIKGDLYTLLEALGAVGVVTNVGGIVGSGLLAVSPRAAAAWGNLPWYVVLPGELAAGYAVYQGIERFGTKYIPPAIEEAKRVYNELYHKRQTVPLLPEDFKKFQLLLNLVQNATLVPTLRQLDSKTYKILPAIIIDTIPLSAEMRRSYLEALEMEKLRNEEERKRYREKLRHHLLIGGLKRIRELQEKMQNNPKIISLETKESER